MKSLPKFTGSHPLVNDLNRIVDCIKERTPIPSPEFLIEEHAHGFKPIVKPSKTTGSPSSDARWS